MLTANGQKDRAARGITHQTNTMKIALSILLGVNAMLGLLIFILSHQI